MKKKSILLDWGLRLAVFIAAVGLWELFLRGSQNFLLPRFSEMASALFHLLFSETRFWQALYISNQALILGFAISVVVGMPLGLLAGRFRWMDRILNPYVGVLLTMPVAPLIPIVIIALGESIVAVGVFAGLTAYDTQRIKSMYAYVAGTDMMGKVVIMGALNLYLDFINMFTFLLSFMGDRR